MARILLVDDNAAFLSTVGRVLRRCGHEVTSTNSAGDAICLLAAKPPPDLLLLDMVFGGCEDGRTVIGALGPSAPPVIVVSGDAVDESLLVGGHVKRVLAKPFSLKTLLQAINGTLGITGGEEFCTNGGDEFWHGL